MCAVSATSRLSAAAVHLRANISFPALLQLQQLIFIEMVRLHASLPALMKHVCGMAAHLKYMIVCMWWSVTTLSVCRLLCVCALCNTPCVYRTAPHVKYN